MTKPAAGTGRSGAPARLKYYMFDWDDNVLHMPTRIYIERRTARGWKSAAVSTAVFARLRRDRGRIRPPGGDWDRAFRDFNDTGRRGERAFLDDTRAALARVRKDPRKIPPSFKKFRQALVEGRLFAIISARSHHSRSIRQGVEFFIRTMLSRAEKEAMTKNLRGYVRYFDGKAPRGTDRQLRKRYLDLCQYWGVSSLEFRKRAGLRSAGSENPERAKQLAIREFVKHVLKLSGNKGRAAPISVGFSDDDIQNVRAARNYLQDTLARRYPFVRFVVYDTSRSSRALARKTVIGRS